MLAVTGSLMVLVFLLETIIALVQRDSSFGFWSWVAAAETASWRLKWVAFPVTILVAVGARKLYRSVVESPTQFCGLNAARRGYIASAAVPLLILVLIGVTVPERLRQRQLGIDAGIRAQGYRIDRALLEYQQMFGTLPSDLKDLNRLPDNDGSIASALRGNEGAAYTVNAELAAVPKQKPRNLRGAVIRNASLTTATDEPLSGGLSFTNYDLLLPGPDKIAGTEDDLLVRDGVITKASETPRRGVSRP
jgi:hypothetical protein